MRLNNDPLSAVFPVGGRGGEKVACRFPNKGGSGEEHGRPASACDFKQLREGDTMEGSQSGAKTYDRDRDH